MFGRVTLAQKSLTMRNSIKFEQMVRHLHPAIPQAPVKSKFKHINTSDNHIDKQSVIDSSTIEHLERISLVDFANVKGIERLEEAIKLANVIRTVDTTGYEPMYTVLEDQSLFLREDEAVHPNCRESLMKIASVTEEDYFVAPQGNVPLSSLKNYERE